MLFLYQNQVLFKEFSLCFPLKINFLMTIVQNHEKSLTNRKIKNFLCKVEGCATKKIVFYVYCTITSSENAVFVPKSSVSQKNRSVFPLKPILFGPLCKITKNCPKATAVAIKIRDMTGGKIFLTPEEVLQKCDSRLLDFYFVKIFSEVRK